LNLFVHAEGLGKHRLIIFCVASLDFKHIRLSTLLLLILKRMVICLMFTYVYLICLQKRDGQERSGGRGKVGIV
jgi:hypothetical protein